MWRAFHKRELQAANALRVGGILVGAVGTYIYQMMMSYFKGTADAVVEYCSAVSCPNAPNTF